MLQKDGTGGAVGGGKPKREGIHLHRQLIHVVAQQKLKQHCQEIVLQFNKK